MIEITHRYTSAVLYQSEDAKTVREALEAARGAGADLSGADLSGANLSWADLSEADLYGTNLYGADLSDTVLQPGLPTNKHGEFEAVNGECVGYRTRTSPHCGDMVYEDGKEYGATVFSVCPLTACHPGLYVYLKAETVTARYPRAEVIEVRFQRNDLHAASGKYRVRRFRVTGKANTK